MPVILSKAEEGIWLSKTLALETKMSVLAPFPEALMKRTKVSKRVNSVSTLKKPNNDPNLLLPLYTDDQWKRPSTRIITLMGLLQTRLPNL